MLKRPLTDEMRFLVVLLFVFILASLVFVLLDRFLIRNAPSPKTESKQETTDNKASSTPAKATTVIVTEPEKQKPVQNKSVTVVNSIREAIKLGNHSTARIQLSTLSKDSAEYGELQKLLAAEAAGRKHPGVRKEANRPQDPVRYLDESSPREKTVDAIYLYFVETSGTFWPRFSIQSVGARPLDITGFKVLIDGKTYAITPSTVKKEKTGGKTAEYCDAPLDQQSYAVARALVNARKASVVAVGSGGERVREISENEKKGMGRIMETYRAFGGNFLFIEEKAAPPKKGKAAQKNKR